MGANRGNCGVMGVNFEASQQREKVSRSHKWMPDGQHSISSTERYVLSTENSETFFYPEEDLSQQQRD